MCHCREWQARLIPGLGRSPRGHGNPLQYSCLENSMDRRAWQAAVHGVTWSRKESDTTEHTHTHTPQVTLFCFFKCLTIFVCILDYLIYTGRISLKNIQLCSDMQLPLSCLNFSVFFYIFLLLIQGSLFSFSVQLILLLRKKFYCTRTLTPHPYEVCSLWLVTARTIHNLV